MEDSTQMTLAKPLAIAKRSKETIEVSRSLTKRLRAVMNYHAAAWSCNRRVLDDAIEGLKNRALAGHELLAMKAEAGHGRWLVFMRKQCRLSERTVQIYMRLARHWDIIAGRLAELSKAFANPHGAADLDGRDLVNAVVRAVLNDSGNPPPQHAIDLPLDSSTVERWAQRWPDWIRDEAKLTASVAQWPAAERQVIIDRLKPAVRLHDSCQMAQQSACQDRLVHTPHKESFS